MCGIVGYVGPRQATAILLEGLKRMEYRGYDSAGIAVINGDGVKIRKAAGKLSVLVDHIKGSEPNGTVGVGHTRWATHGAPTTPNAHPHTDKSGRIAVIHNGIIENFREIRDALRTEGAQFSSETDTEVVAHLISREMKISEGEMFNNTNLEVSKRRITALGFFERVDTETRVQRI